ncbi:MAG TPA: hypothetical protein VFL27_04445 [Candidatus Dormibacteraeota bacterium]|nr:hypothetical protein [Candidatus Dormibacteraeota bacterium]
MAEVSDDELTLILEALEDAAVYRDARSRVLDSAVRRQARRKGAPPTARPAEDASREQARAYLDLALKLKAARARRR